jgi:hypothetical protein
MVEGLNRGDDEETSLAQPGRSSILRNPRRGRSELSAASNSGPGATFLFTLQVEAADT